MKCKEKKLYCSRTLPPDMLNNFPENVIDKILMCLPFRDAVRTNILSTKWRYVWRILPELMLSHTNWKPEEDLTDLTSNFRKIIDHILSFHFGPVTKFTLSIPYFDICPIIDDLIHFLSRNGIQHLVLRLPIRGKPYEVPSSLFTCSQLRHLTLQNCVIPHQPAFKRFERLISLELRDVTISCKLLEHFISRCLLVEQLVLQISGASRNIIKISAPMLRSNDYTGNLRCVCLKTIPLLAKLSLSHREYYLGAGKCNIAKFFEPFSALEHIHLNDMVESDDNHVPPLESLEVEHFSDVTFNHLREVKIMQTNVTIPEIQLVKLLLAKSPELVRILIVPCLVKEFATVHILAELIRLQRASPNAEVEYNLDKHPNPRPVSFSLARKFSEVDEN
ncbi:putative dentin sialophosphoprotein-like [Capsicum annuum]|nr:putative dentin sialophosphoprotein-like [Capsicum annuum]